MEKDSYWFRHDSSAGRGLKIRKMQHIYGHWAKGIYWDVVEILRDQKNYTYPKDESSLQLLCSLIGCLDIDKFMNWFNDCIRVELLIINEDYFYCPPLSKSLHRWDYLKENGKKGGRPKNTKNDEKNDEKPHKTEITKTKPNNNLTHNLTHNLNDNQEITKDKMIYNDSQNDAQNDAQNNTETDIKPDSQDKKIGDNSKPNDNLNLTITGQDSTEQNKLVNCVCEIVSFLNSISGKRYSPHNGATKRVLGARLREGWVVSDFEAVILDKCAKWGKDPTMKQYLRPITLFGTKFESYVQNVDKKNIEIKNNNSSKNSFLDTDPDLQKLDPFYLTQMTPKHKKEYINQKRNERNDGLLPDTGT